MSAVTRITFKRTRPNPLFQDWLEELHEEAQQKGSKLAPMLKEALSSITKYPLPLQSGAECAILKGFDKRLCLFLDKRLEVYTSIASVSNEEVAQPNSVPQVIDSDKSSRKECLNNSISPNSLISDSENERFLPQLDGSKKSSEKECLDQSPNSPISLISDDDNEERSLPQLEDSKKSSEKECLDQSPNSPISLISDDDNEERSLPQLEDSKKSSEKECLDQSVETLICLISDEENEEIPTLDTQSSSLPSAESESVRNSGSTEISNSLPSCSTSSSSPRNKNKRRYTPAFRSGSYAFLMALVDLKKDQTMNKDQLVTVAQNHCDTNIKKDWKSMLRLLKRGLVKKIGGRNKSLFCLTEAGYSLAKELYRNTEKKNGVKGNHVDFKSESEVNDLLFDSNKCTNEVVMVNNREYNGVSNGLLDNVQNHRLDDENQCQSEEIAVKDKEATSALLCGETTINDPNSCSGSNSTESIQDHVDYSNLIVMEPGAFDIVLLIDCHETSGLTKKNDPTVTQFKKYPELKHEYRSLKVGDFTWIARSKINKDVELVLPFVVERKRMDDLGHSIKDGRFHEQKFRLRKCGLNNVIYLVENHGSNKHVGLPMQSLMQALANTRVHDGFKVHVTESLVHSVRFLATMTLRLIYEYKDKRLKGHNKEPRADILMSFEYFNKSSVKNRALSVTDTFIKLLLQLKGVSVEKALTITSVYKTPRLLIEKYKSCEQREGEMLLANLKFGELNRSVGPSVSKSVYQLFTFRTTK